MTPVLASMKKNAKIIYNNPQVKGQKHKPKVQFGQLFRTADIEKVFSEGDGTKWSNKLYIQSQKT